MVLVLVLVKLFGTRERARRSSVGQPPRSGQWHNIVFCTVDILACLLIRGKEPTTWTATLARFTTSFYLALFHDDVDIGVRDGSVLASEYLVSSES